MKIEIQRNETSLPLVYDDEENAYTKGSMYCILFMKDGNRITHKFPLITLFRVIEDYAESKRNTKEPDNEVHQHEKAEYDIGMEHDEVWKTLSDLESRWVKDSTGEWNHYFINVNLKDDYREYYMNGDLQFKVEINPYPRTWKSEMT